ncbi:MAG: efflux RND transporter periplasmic adaptor subunit [Verrucomicrobiota bacterium]|nr:efflux RND transporter periplasmic adaptor subunit [Verrucomicrobiota bacterium]MDE3066097.1 efflux RND transporter periplasmic adaptor subunit [Verrucomicrobiota bacterium]
MKRIRIVIGILIAGGIVAGLWFWHDREQTASANQLILFGNVDIRQVQLAFNDSERVSAVLVQEGDRVRPGQLLATLDTLRLAAGVGKAGARVAAQRQVVARLEAGSRPQEIRKARADMEAAQADLENARLNYMRVTNLVSQTVEAQQSSDDARAALDMARARLAAAKETYDLMVLGPRQEDIAAAKAMLQADEAGLALARQNLADASLYAPTNGVIEDRLLEPGDMASPQKPVFTLALNDPVWVRAYVAETDLGKIHPGMNAVVTTDSFPGKRYDGWIGFISPTAEFTPKTVETAEVRAKLVYQFRVFVRNPQDELRLGMPAVVTIPLDRLDTQTDTASEGEKLP